MTSVAQTDAPTGASQTVDGIPSHAASGTPNATASQQAGLGDRAIAAVVDTLVLGGAFAVIGNWAATRWGGVTSSGFEMTGTPAAVTILLTGLFGFVYYWVLEGTVGATAGKAVVGLRVRHLDGSTAGLGASLTRNLCRLIDGIAFYLVGWIIASCSKRRQRLGDHLAHTIVVSDSAPAGRVIGAVGLAAFCAVVVVGVIAVRHGGAQSAVALGTSAHTGDVAGDVRSAPAPSDQSAGAAGAGASPLAISNVVWMDRAGGPPRASTPYTPDNTAYGAYQLSGFAHASDGHVDVAIRISPTDPSGAALDDPIANDVRTTGAATGPINGQFQVHLPPFVPAGVYSMRMTVHDAIGNTDGQFAPSFTVTAPPQLPAGALEVRDFVFSNSEGGDAVADPVYHAGQTVYLAMKFSGIQFRHDTTDVKIGLALLDPKGTVVMNKDDWATIAQRFVYHPSAFFIPATSNITLPSPVSPGTYAFRFTIADHVAATTVTSDAKFDVK